MADSIDKESLDLIIKLQLEDAEGLLRGKQTVAEASDAELAARLFKSELEHIQSFDTDHIICRSIARATIADGDAIQYSVSVEQQAIYDREYARNFGSRNYRPRRHSHAPHIDDETMEKLAKLYVGVDEVGGRGSDHAESSAQGAKAGKRSEDRRCVSCDEKISSTDTIRCPCSHEYCRTCIAGLFEAAINDESRYPARCCRQVIPLGSNQRLLPPRLAERYHAKEVEYSTPNRTYCHGPSCSAFIPTESIRGSRATCVRCQRRTCTDCKGPSHRGECPPDAAALDTLRMANEQGWQRCYSCRNVVELSTGKFIACRCGAEFCYVCGARWKRCDCEQWHEERLLDRAHVVVERDVDAGRRMNEAERAYRMEQEQRDLRGFDACWHAMWRLRAGSLQCENCWYLSRHIYECFHCRLLACRTCLRNRL